MKIIKGFVGISPYVNNVPGVTSPLGELSTWSSTYSKEKGEYQNVNVPGYKLITFSSRDSITEQQAAVSDPQALEILSVIRAMVAYGSTHIRPYPLVDFHAAISAEFYEIIAQLQVGSFVDNGLMALPQWVSWTSAANNGNQIKVWLSDDAFQNQYDGYEINIIPPIEPLDLFFGSYNTAIAQVNTRTLSSSLGELVQNAKSIYPETYIRFNEYNFINPLNPAQSTKIIWPMLIYGIAGDNVDNTKDSLINYILANSSHTRAEWETIIPDLFKRTEFTIIPRWDKLAVPNLTTISGLYGSFMDPNECVAMAKLAVPSESVIFVENNVTIFPYDYKAITLVAVNGSANVDGKKTLTEIFPDYLPINTSLPDFNRMQVKTREWSLLLEKLLLAAETATLYTTIPIGTRRVVRNGFLFVTAMYDNVHYLVAARSNGFYIR